MKTKTRQQFFKLTTGEKLGYLQDMLAPEGVSHQGDVLRQQFEETIEEVIEMEDQIADVERAHEEINSAVETLRDVANDLEAL